jgi:hypothetical protein
MVNSIDLGSVSGRLRSFLHACQRTARHQYWMSSFRRFQQPKFQDVGLQIGENDGMARLLFLVALLLASAGVQAHDLRANADYTNDWLEGLTNGENVACCGVNDCYPLHPEMLRLHPDGNLTVEINGQWFLVLERYLLRDRSPDGRAWVCPNWTYIERSLQGVRCLLLPRVM